MCHSFDSESLYSSEISAKHVQVIAFDIESCMGSIRPEVMQQPMTWETFNQGRIKVEVTWEPPKNLVTRDIDSELFPNFK